MKASRKISEILDYLHISANKLSVEIGLKQNTKIYHLKNDRNDFSTEMADLITKRYPEISYNWLLTGEGEMLNSATTEETLTLETIDIGYSKEKQLQSNIIKKVPYYEVDVTSSIVTSFSDVIEEPAFFVDFKPFNDCSAYVNNFGDSMYPKYKNGEKLAVKQIHNLDVIMWGETYLVITNENANDLRTIKDVHFHEDKDKIILRASNPSFKGDTIINKSDIISMFAVKGKISQNFM